MVHISFETTNHKIMKSKYLLFLFFLIPCLGFTQVQYASRHYKGDPRKSPRKTIQVALILDTSGSMDGLLEQAKSQLWYIVNGLTDAYDGDRHVRLEMALYEYGKARLGYSRKYMQNIVPFTSDLDWISEELFDLNTGGGKEYCGAVIQLATDQLDWSDKPQDLRLIYIAGNESFSQGPVNYRHAVHEAFDYGISVNTIFCGNHREGVRLGWKDAAIEGGGEYMSIDQNYQQYNRPTGGDREWMQLDARLNSTYVPYGKNGRTNKSRQLTQDQRAQRLGGEIHKQRVLTKASNSYRNENWDLVDAVSVGTVQLKDVPYHELPQEMRRMSLAEKERYINDKLNERRQVKSAIRSRKPSGETLSQTSKPSRNAGNAPEVKKKPDTLGDVIVKSAQKQKETKRTPTPVKREKPGRIEPKVQERTPSTKSSRKLPTEVQVPKSDQEQMQEIEEKEAKPPVMSRKQEGSQRPATQTKVLSRSIGGRR